MDTVETKLVKRTKRPPGTIYWRVALLFDCFARLGAGQTELAREMGISPQVIRRRAADARYHRHPRGMPLDQLKQMAQIAVREIPPLRGMNWQILVAWMAELDTLLAKKGFDANILHEWKGEPSPATVNKIVRWQKKQQIQGR